MSNIQDIINSLESAVKQIEQVRNHANSNEVDRDLPKDFESQKNYEKNPR